MKCGIVNFMISHFKSSHLMIALLLSSQFLISFVSKEIVKCDIVKFTIPYWKIKVYFSSKHRIVNFMITHFVISRFSNENVKREIVNFIISYLTISFFYLIRTMQIPLIYRTQSQKAVKTANYCVYEVSRSRIMICDILVDQVLTDFINLSGRSLPMM